MDILVKLSTDTDKPYVMGNCNNKILTSIICVKWIENNSDGKEHDPRRREKNHRKDEAVGPVKSVLNTSIWCQLAQFWGRPCHPKGLFSLMLNPAG